MIVFAIFMFGLMISLVVLKGILQAQDFLNERLKEAPLDKATGESDAAGGEKLRQLSNI